MAFPAAFSPNTQNMAAAILSAAGGGPPGSVPSLPHPIPVPLNARGGQGGPPFGMEDEAMILLKKHDLDAMLSCSRQPNPLDAMLGSSKANPYEEKQQYVRSTRPVVRS
jgi:hypothetical protein